MMKLWLPTLITVICLACTVEARVRLHVDASLTTGGNNGTTWNDAYQGPDGLQAALATATSGDEVWIAAGTYLPSNTGDREASFSPADGVSLYGGFAGGESELSERDIANNVTILSGDLADDDLPNFGNRDDNTYHVLFMETGSILIDGCTIRGGRAQDDADFPRAGGGAHVSLGAVVDFVGCHFTENEGRDAGGLEIAGEAHVLYCVFSDNHAVNEFGTGGAARSLVGFDTHKATFTNSLFYGNTAGIGGGALAADHSGFQLNNCTVVGNRVIDGVFGGGVMQQGTFGTMEIANSIIWGNSTSTGDSDELNQMWNPNLPSFLVLNNSSIQNYSGTREFAGAGNSGTNPSFVNLLGNDGQAGTGDEDYRLSGTSTLIDAGNNTLVPAGLQTDLNGEPRFVDIASVTDTGIGTAPIVDLGAFEAQSAGVNVPAVGSWGLVLCLITILIVASCLMMPHRCAMKD
ncbi:MAG: hypothetical protein ACPGXK_01355 [Phycisphaerae bacterium]